MAMLFSFWAETVGGFGRIASSSVSCYIIGTIIRLSFLQFGLNGAIAETPQLAQNLINTKLPEVTEAIQINAPIAKVWRAIQKRRVSDAAHRELVSYNGSEAVIREKFSAMPIIGSTSCDYLEKETAPGRMIDYKLVDSDHLKAFEGQWLLSPGSGPNSTSVSLTSRIDPGIRCPLWKQIARATLARTVGQTLREVESIALSN